MLLTLKFIVGGLIATIAVIVGATSLGITLITSLDTINKVGEAWALGMANGVRELVGDSFEKDEGRLMSATNFMRREAPMLPVDLMNQGINSTLIWNNWLMVQARKKQFLFASISLVFERDAFFQYTSESRMVPKVQIVEWCEEPVSGGGNHCGGYRYHRNNMSLVPYGPATNYFPEAVHFDIPRATQQAGDFNSLRNALKFRTSLLPHPLDAACFWLPPQHVVGRESQEIYWDLFGACDLKNTSGFVVGYSFVSLALDLQIRSLLTDSPRSVNGNNFIVDDKGYLIGTTYSAPFYTSEPTTAIAAPPDGCSNSYRNYPESAPRMGCRKSPKAYEYAPLNAVPESIYLTKNDTASTVVTSGGEDYIAVGKRYVTGRGGFSFVVVSIVPVSDLLGDVNSGTNAAIGAAVGLIFVAVAIAVVLLYVILQALDDIAAKMQRTAQLEGLDKEDVLDDNDDDNESENGNDQQNAKGRRKSITAVNEESSSASHRPQNSSWISEVAQLEAAYVVTHNSLVSFTRYVPKNVVKELMNAGGAAKMSMQSTTITCSFADIQGFTSICEAVQPKPLSEMLHLYFKKMTRLVMAHGGIIDRFIGDCIMAVWGAPFKVARHELLGALCALASQREAARNPLKQKFLESGFKLAVRIGVASGSVLAGNIGSKTRVAYTVLGEAVQAANALEPYNKQWGTLVMVNEEVARECNEELVLRLFTRAKFTGCTKPTMCYEVMGTSRDAVLKKTRSRGSGKNGEGDSSTYSGSASDDMSSPTSPSGSPFSSGRSNDDMQTTTTATDSSITSGDSSGSGDDVLPANVNLESLLKWHKKRTSVDDSVVNFAAAFSEAARMSLDQDFPGALKRLKSVEEDELFPFVHRSHKSVATLRALIEMATRRDESVVVTTKLTTNGVVEDFYVLAE